MFGALTLDNRPSVSPGMDSGRPSLTVKHRLRGTDSGVAEHTIGMCGIEEMLLILWVTVIFCELSQFIKNFFNELVICICKMAPELGTWNILNDTEKNQHWWYGAGGYWEMEHH